MVERELHGFQDVDADAARRQRAGRRLALGRLGRAEEEQRARPMKAGGPTDDGRELGKDADAVVGNTSEELIRVESAADRARAARRGPVGRVVTFEDDGAHTASCEVVRRAGAVHTRTHHRDVVVRHDVVSVPVPAGLREY